jgi:hypothetical protein
MVKTAIIAPPCVAEFGWELMRWQGRVRELAKTADKVVVCSTESHLPLYEDMRDKLEFIPHAIEGQRNGHSIADVTNPDELQRASRLVEQRKVDLLDSGAYSIVTVAHKRWRLHDQDFVQYGAPDDTVPEALVVHARARTWNSKHNWPVGHWDALVNHMRRTKEPVIAIGTKSGAYCPRGAADWRDRPLQNVMNLLAKAFIVVGPSSGPMVLASLCGAPHLVWTDSRKHGTVGVTNKKRFQSEWNPFGTPVHVMDRYGWCPPVRAVWDRISKTWKAWK